MALDSVLCHLVVMIHNGLTGLVCAEPLTDGERENCVHRAPDGPSRAWTEGTPKRWRSRSWCRRAAAPSIGRETVGGQDQPSLCRCFSRGILTSLLRSDRRFIWSERVMRPL